MSRPLFSVVIPSYNRGHIVGDAIESALAQRDSADIEVILADDGSTDVTAAVAKQLGADVIYLHQEHSGAAAARNLAVRASRGDFIAFLDSDDIWLPGKIRSELDVFEQFGDADAVVSDASSWLEDQPVYASWLAAKEFPVVPNDPFLASNQHELWISGSRFATSSTTLRRRCLAMMNRPHLYDAELPGYEDWEMEIRMLRYCTVAVLPRVLSKIRRYADGTRQRMPGVEPAVAQHRQNLRCEIEILERSIAFGWPENVERKAREKCERLRARLV